MYLGVLQLAFGRLLVAFGIKGDEMMPDMVLLACTACTAMPAAMGARNQSGYGWRELALRYHDDEHL